VIPRGPQASRLCARCRKCRTSRLQGRQRGIESVGTKHQTARPGRYRSARAPGNLFDDANAVAWAPYRRSERSSRTRGVPVAPPGSPFVPTPPFVPVFPRLSVSVWVCPCRFLRSACSRCSLYSYRWRVGLPSQSGPAAPGDVRGCCRKCSSPGRWSPLIATADAGGIAAHGDGVGPRVRASTAANPALAGTGISCTAAASVRVMEGAAMRRVLAHHQGPGRALASRQLSAALAKWRPA
jgi:hypothetical protein